MTNIRPYTKQFYKNNRLCFAVAFSEAIFSAAIALVISWLLREILDLIGGSSAFTLGELVLISVALCLGVLGGDVDVEHLLEVGRPEDMLLQEVTEALGRVGGKADVLVHVEGVDAVPRDLFVGGQPPQHLVLGGGGGEDHVDGLLGFQ